MVSVCILTGYGVNAEEELAEAFRGQGAWVRLVHLHDLLENRSLLNGFQILGIPGGFSFGDHLGSGRVFALLLRRYLRPQLARFVADGKLIIGVCNGFQVLVKSGILPDLDGEWEPSVSLIHNDGGTFVDKWVRLEWNRKNESPWLNELRDTEMPIRHGEGRFIFGSEATRRAVVSGNLIALRYAGENPNGSEMAIAGITDRTGRVLGLMPHPEAYLVHENHPRWNVEPAVVPPTHALFRNAVEFVSTSVLR